MAITLNHITFDAKFLVTSLVIGLLVFSTYSYEDIENYNAAKNDLNNAIKECLTQKKLDGLDMENWTICDEKSYLSLKKFKQENPNNRFVRATLHFNEELASLPIQIKLQFSLIKYYFILIMGYAFAIGIAPIFWKFLLKRITELVKAFKG